MERGQRGREEKNGKNREINLKQNWPLLVLGISLSKQEKKEIGLSKHTKKNWFIQTADKRMGLSKHTKNNCFIQTYEKELDCLNILHLCWGIFFSNLVKFTAVMKSFKTVA